MQSGRAGTPVRTIHEKIKFVQINVDRRTATHDVVEGWARREGVDVLLIGEPNRRLCAGRGWLTDLRQDAAIVFLNSEVVIHATGGGDGFVWAELTDTIVCSCYCSSNVPIRDFENFITRIDEDTRRRTKQIVKQRQGSEITEQ